MRTYVEKFLRSFLQEATVSPRSRYMKKAKVGFVSLGCSKNLCDTEVMLKHLVDDVY